MTESASIMRFKAQIRNYAKAYAVPAQTAMQNFMFERFLLRLSKSRFREKLVIKGGFLISAIVGLPKRTTMDIDTTLRGMPLDEAGLADTINEICATGDDGISFILRLLLQSQFLSRTQNDPTRCLKAFCNTHVKSIRIIRGNHVIRDRMFCTNRAGTLRRF